MAASGQFPWPPPVRFMAGSGQNLVAPDTPFGGRRLTPHVQTSEPAPTDLGSGSAPSEPGLPDSRGRTVPHQIAKLAPLLGPEGARLRADLVSALARAGTSRVSQATWAYRPEPLRLGISSALLPGHRDHGRGPRDCRGAFRFNRQHSHRRGRLFHPLLCKAPGAGPVTYRSLRKAGRTRPAPPPASGPRPTPASLDVGWP